MLPSDNRLSKIDFFSCRCFLQIGDRRLQTSDPSPNSLTTLYASRPRGSFTIFRMKYLGFRIAFLVLVIILCCGFSLWTLNGRKSDTHTEPEMMQIANPSLIYSEGIEQSGF